MTRTRLKRRLPQVAGLLMTNLHMSLDLRSTARAAWEARDGVSRHDQGAVREAVEAALELLDRGKARVAERAANGDWTVNQWLKKAVLLSFRLNDMETSDRRPGRPAGWDKVPSSSSGWGESRFRDAGFRAVPGAIVAPRGAFVGRNVVLMPSFVNIGAYVDEGHDGRHLGHGRLLRPDRQERAPLRRRRHRRRAGAAAGQPDHHRGRLLHRRPLGGGRGRDRAARARCCRWASILGASTKIIDRATGEVFTRRGAALFRWSCRAPCRQADGSPARPSLRGHRQARRRPDALKTAVNELLRD